MSREFVSNTIPKAIFRALTPPTRPAVPEDAARPELSPESVRRMHLNESAYPPAPTALQAMKAACDEAHRYPDPEWRELGAAIAERTGIAASRLVIFNGSDEAIVTVGHIALEPGDEMVCATPSFPGYDHSAEIQGARVLKVPVRADGAMDVDAMLEAVTPRTRLLFCTTPNNPTGGLLEAASVERLCEQLPDSVLLVLDEAYHEFGLEAGGAEHLARVAAHRRGPWVVLRTFSKAYGLAGIRVGYGLCGSDDLADAMQQVRNVFNVSRIAQAGALAAWQDVSHRDWIISQTATERARLLDGLAQLGCVSLPSACNFVATRLCGRNAAQIIETLERGGIMVRPIPAPGYEDYIRITIGLPEDTDALIDALSRILATNN